MDDTCKESTVSDSQIGKCPATYRGRDYFEVASAFQKSIRRNLLDDALYWGSEIYCSDLGFFGFKNIWNRLHIISVEDIGPADPNAVFVVVDLYRQAESLYESKKCSIEYFQTAVHYLVRAPKSRVNDWASLVNFAKFEPTEVESLPSPSTADILKDSLTLKQSEVALWALYTLVKSSLVPASVARNFSKSPAHPIVWKIFENLSSDPIFQKYLDTLKVAEKNCYSHRIDKCYLIFIHLVHVWCRPTNLETKAVDVIIFDRETKDAKYKDIPDYAIDKHTQRGRSIGRDFKHFIEVGSQLVNEDPDWMTLSNFYLHKVRSLHFQVVAT